MKALINAIAIALVITVLCSCGGGVVEENLKPGSKLSITDNVAALSGLNFSLDISKDNLLGDSGVVLATYNNAKGANDIIATLGSECNIPKFDTEKQGSFVLVIVTLGEGKSANYTVEEVYMNARNDKPNVDVYVSTTGSDESAPLTYEYHLVEVSAPYFGYTVTVFLDGVQVGK